MFLSRRCKLVQLSSVAMTSALVLGCGARIPEPSQDGAQLFREVEDVEKHNVKTQTNHRWSVEVWTSGALFMPGQPIGVTIHLAPGSKSQEDKPRATIECDIRRSDSAPVPKSSRYDLDLVERRLVAPAWEATLSNIFPNHANYRQSEVMEEGSYMMSLTIVVDEADKFHFDSIPIRVKVVEGH